MCISFDTSRNLRRLWEQGIFDNTTCNTDGMETSCSVKSILKNSFYASQHQDQVFLYIWKHIQGKYEKLDLEINTSTAT